MSRRRRLVPQLLFASLLVIAGCDAMLEELMPSEVRRKASPSPTPIRPRFGQPSPPHTITFQPRQWIAQVRLGDDRAPFNGEVQLVALSNGAGHACWAWGQREGALMRSDDGGANWRARPIAATKAERQVALQFLDAKKGFLATTTKLYGTEDGGDTWSLLRDFELRDPGSDQALENAGQPIGDVHFRDYTRGWVAKGTVLYKTTDGGKSWSTEKVPGENFQINALAVVGDDLWLGTTRGVMRFVPGLGWGLPAGKLSIQRREGLVFTSATEGWATGSPLDNALANAGLPLWKTTDAGDTWTLFQPRDLAGEVVRPKNGVQSLAFSWADAQHGWLSFGNDLYATSDGGRTWAADQAAERAGLRGIAAIELASAQAGWVVANRTIYRFAELR